MSEETRPKGIRLGIIGTSLCQQNDIGTAAKISHWCRGWLSWARVLSNEIFVCPIWQDARLYLGWEPSGVADARRYFQGLNAGVSGQFIPQIDLRKQFFDFVSVDAVLLDGGTNDMATSKKEDIQALREKIADYYLSRGIAVIMVPILARAVSSWSAGGAERRKAAWINQRTRQFVQSRRNCYFWDWNKAWVDFTNANGEPRTGYSNDGIHFATLGGYAVGKDLAAFLATIFPQAQPRVMSPDDLYDATHNPTGNLLTNPFLAGTGGNPGTGASGSVATGYRAERSGATTGTVAASKESRADGRGAYQVLTFTPGGAAGTELFLFRTAASDVAYALQPGDWVQASFEVECSAWAGWRGISMYLKDNATGGLIANGMEENADAWPTEAWKGTITTPPLRLVDGVSTLRWRAEIRIDGQTAGTGVVKIGAVELRKVEDPRAALNFRY